MKCLKLVRTIYTCDRDGKLLHTSQEFQDCIEEECPSYILYASDTNEITEGCGMMDYSIWREPSTPEEEKMCRLHKPLPHPPSPR